MVMCPSGRANVAENVVFLKPVYSDTTQLDVDLSWVELRRYKRAFR